MQEIFSLILYLRNNVLTLEYYLKTKLNKL